MKDSWFDSNGNKIKYFNKYVNWEMGNDEPADAAKKYGKLYGVSKFQGKMDKEWYHVPFKRENNVIEKSVICVQQIIPITTTTSKPTSILTTTKSRVCNQVTLKGKASCITYFGRKNRAEGEKACKVINGTLPQPRSSTDVFNLLAAFLIVAPGTGSVPFYIDMFRDTNKGKV